MKETWNAARLGLMVALGLAVEDASVTMRTLSLLGERVLVIRPGTPGLPEIPDGGEIRVADRGVSTDEIMVTVNEIANSVKKITARLERVFGTQEAGDRMENVELTTDDLSEIIHKRKDEIDQGIGEVDDTTASIHRTADQLNSVLADVKEVTGCTAHGEGTIGRLTEDEALIDQVEGVAEGRNSFVGGLNRLRAPSWSSEASTTHSPTPSTRTSQST